MKIKRNWVLNNFDIPT